MRMSQKQSKKSTKLQGLRISVLLRYTNTVLGTAIMDGEGK